MSDWITRSFPRNISMAPPEGAAVFEFPSMEVARSWYNSPAYRAIRHHRERGAKYIGILMEGGALPPHLRMPQTIGNLPKAR
jgi:hypothetical protein